MREFATSRRKFRVERQMRQDVIPKPHSSSAIPGLVFAHQIHAARANRSLRGGSHSGQALRNHTRTAANAIDPYLDPVPGPRNQAADSGNVVALRERAGDRSCTPGSCRRPAQGSSRPFLSDRHAQSTGLPIRPLWARHLAAGVRTESRAAARCEETKGVPANCRVRLSQPCNDIRTSTLDK